MAKVADAVVPPGDAARIVPQGAKKPEIGEQVATALLTVGVAFALLLLLEAAFGKRK